MRRENDRRGDSRSNSRGGGFNGNNNSNGNRYGGGSDRSFDRGPRESHKATCAECGTDCDVPFKPTEGRPVYCRDCFAKHRPARY